MTYKHIKFLESEVMRSLEKIAFEKGLVSNNNIYKKMVDLIIKSAILDPIGTPGGADVDAAAVSNPIVSSTPEGRADQERHRQMITEYSFNMPILKKLEIAKHVFLMLFGFVPIIGDTLDLIMGLHELSTAKSDADIYLAMLQITCAAPLAGDIVGPIIMELRLLKMAHGDDFLKLALKDPSFRELFIKANKFILDEKDLIKRAISTIKATAFIESVAASGAMLKYQHDESQQKEKEKDDKFEELAQKVHDQNEKIKAITQSLQVDPNVDYSIYSDKAKVIDENREENLKKADRVNEIVMSIDPSYQ